MGSGCSNCATKDDEKYQVEIDRDSFSTKLPKDSEAVKLYI
jgi:hypothetical protein